MRIYIIKGSFWDHSEQNAPTWNFRWFSDETLAKTRLAEIQAKSDKHSAAIGGRQAAYDKRIGYERKRRSEILDNAGDGMTFAGVAARDAFFAAKLIENKIPIYDQARDHAEWLEIREEQHKLAVGAADSVGDPKWQPGAQYELEELEEG